jgi:hypothetical protein
MITIPHTIQAEDGPAIVDAQPATPGLYVYRTADTVDVGAVCRWRLGHHSGLQIARFRSAEDAHRGAAMLADWTTWTDDADSLRGSIASRQDRAEFLLIIQDMGGHVGNCAHPAPDPDWPIRGGHGESCAYAAGISCRCTCD